MNNLMQVRELLFTLANKIKSQQGDSLNGFSWVFRIPSGIVSLNFNEVVPYGGGGYFMQCVDMNNDNYPDIVTSSGTILINDGSGVFTNSWFIPDVDPFQPIVVDDFDRDGFMDVFYYGVDGLKIGLVMVLVFLIYQLNHIGFINSYRQILTKMDIPI